MSADMAGAVKVSTVQHWWAAESAHEDMSNQAGRDTQCGGLGGKDGQYVFDRCLR
jgi:hypothetical protein